jgi:polyferredoxin
MNTVPSSGSELEPQSPLNLVQMATEAAKKPKPVLKPKHKQSWLTWRKGIQIGFALLNLGLGIQFYRFVHAAQTTTTGPLPHRPAGVEGWLPISGMMGFVDWLHSGAINTIHPAATILFLAFVTIAIVFRKAFCSWLCPVGLISDLLANLGRKIFGRNFLLPLMLDRILMALKYVLLSFFVMSFFFMGLEGISSFLQSPYNQVVDVKMLLFFLNMGTIGITVFIILAIGSIFVQGFWCRYLCPYGALLGLFSWMSPVKVRRNAETCIDCAKCDKICPVRLPIMAKQTIKSVECTGCMECVTVCPVENTLHMGTKKWKPSPRLVGVLVVLTFLIFGWTARIFGVWQTSVSDQAYRYHLSHLEGPDYGHPGMEK